MKLLTKNQITEFKNKERQLDIEQGMSFARKVDSLRELKEKESAELENFRTESVSAVKKEIDSLIRQKEILDIEVRNLEEKRLMLLEPLDCEWEKVKSMSIKVLEMKSNLESSLELLKVDRKEFDKKSNELKNKSEEIDIRISMAKKEYEEILTSKYQAENSLTVTREEMNKVKSLLLDQATMVASRETGVGAREYNLSIKEQNADKRERELNSKERQVNDRYQTLLRTESRIKNK